MTKPLTRLTGTALLGLSACGLLAQNIAPYVELKDGIVQRKMEKPGPPPTPEELRAQHVENARKQREIVGRQFETRSFAFAGSHFGPEMLNPPLIVQTGNLDEKAADQLREDMAVMTRILQKIGLENGAKPEKAMGVDIVIHGGRARNLFIDDYGMIFTININMPLKDSGKPDDGKEKREEPVNEEWESARNELFGGRNSAAVKFLERGARRSYDAQAVKRLRDDLLDSLRNASNIRNLKEDHWVVFVVRGQGGSTVTTGAGDELLLDSPGDTDSTMVIKARKGDIDRYAKKTLTPEEFRNRAVLTTY